MNDPIISGPEPSTWSMLWVRVKAAWRALRTRPAAPAKATPQRSARVRKANTDTDPEVDELERMEAAERARPEPRAPATTDKDNGLIPLPKTLKALVIAPVILFFVLFHLLPVVAELLGAPRPMLTAVTAALPFGDTLGHAMSGWLWAPAWMWIIATLLRLHGLWLLRKDPPAGIMAALYAAALTAGVWLFVGLKQPTAYGPAEQAALILMLKVEGGALLGLFFAFAPLGKRRLGETDAHFNR